VKHHEGKRNLSTVFVWERYHAHVGYVFVVKEVAFELWNKTDE
jgi:hypothetical protein